MTRICLLVLIMLLSLSAAPVESGGIGELVPDFAIQTLDGRSLSRSTLQGQPVLLIFWNTWCPICRRELPEVNRLAESFGPRGLEVIAINTGVNDSESIARAYWQEQGFGFPTAFDHGFVVGTMFRIQAVPTIVLFDSRGVLRFKQARLPGDIAERIQVLLPRASQTELSPPPVEWRLTHDPSATGGHFRVSGRG